MVYNMALDLKETLVTKLPFSFCWQNPVSLYLFGEFVSHVSSFAYEIFCFNLCFISITQAKLINCPNTLRESLPFPTNRQRTAEKRIEIYKCHQIFSKFILSKFLGFDIFNYCTYIDSIGSHAYIVPISQ